MRRNEIEIELYMRRGQPNLLNLILDEIGVSRFSNLVDEMWDVFTNISLLKIRY